MHERERDEPLWSLKLYKRVMASKFAVTPKKPTIEKTSVFVQILPDLKHTREIGKQTEHA